MRKEGGIRRKEEMVMTMVMMIKNNLVCGGSSNSNRSKTNKVYLKLFVVNEYIN